MSADLSTQNLNGHAFRMADALLRSSGGTTAYLQMPVQPGDATDAGQLGLDPPNFQSLALSPVVLRLERPLMTKGQPQKYELLVSGSAVTAGPPDIAISGWSGRPAVGFQFLPQAEHLFGRADQG